MKPFALTRSCTLVSPSRAAGSDHAPGWPSAIAANTWEPPMRSNRNSSHIMFVHRDAPPRENGAMPAALNLGTSARPSPHVCGGGEPTTYLQPPLGSAESAGISSLDPTPLF